MVKITVRLEHVINKTDILEIETEEVNLLTLYNIMDDATLYVNNSDEIIQRLRKTLGKVKATEDLTEYENYYRYKIVEVEKI